ncbi:hypothetical protein HRR81_000352 [Exophiala dermatitidis]|nr:hypothetical protein HRR79_000355 [Exophiala dermatitidis]KAJ4584546.1 hypothetical protein HRR81_000352 [Exophiala dermatitidis]KAJ9004652.1 hypothetical protein HRR94_000354 [Exophiala dermatitidis]
MSSRLASSSKSPPRRVVMPALPVPGRATRSTTPTPSNASSKGEIEGISSRLTGLTILNSSGETGDAQLDPDASNNTPPEMPAVQITSEAPGSPKMEPAVEDDVFGLSTAVELAEDVPSTHVSGSIRMPLEYKGFTPRPDRVSQLPNVANAQGLYPPDALIFVANLSNQRSADQLQFSCHQTFDRFGPCHIKVRQDKNHQPFAFVQFENVDSANAAISASSDMLIDGRKIRVERAKAERAVILSKHDGRPISESEARQLLSKFGPIELCAPTNTMDSARYNMACGIYVKFAYYLDYRDALRNFKNHTQGYILLMAPSVEPRIRGTFNGSPVVRGFSTPRSAVDQKSIYVGNLPDGTTRQDLENIFREFGHIVQVNVIRKNFGDSVNIFAFVEFSNPREAERASLAERSFLGTKLRIEPKEYSARRPQRTMGYIPHTPVRQNTPRNYVEHMSYNGREMYGMNQMTTPPGAYSQGYPLSYSSQADTPYTNTTPLNSALRDVAPPGFLFSPSAAQNVYPYGLGHGILPNSPMYGGEGHIMGPIPEFDEE